MASLGQWLKEEREGRGISLEEIAAATKIVPRYLEALESDRLDLMPGGFFVKGIIRAYAGAVGLDPDGVVAKYKDAGLLSSGAAGHGAFLRRAAAETSRPAPIPPPEPVLPVLPSEEEPPLPPAAAEPSEPAAAAPEIFFEEAAPPRVSPELRKRIFAWAWRIAAALIIVAAGYFLLTSRRDGPAEPPPSTVVAQQELPPPQIDRTPAESAAAPASVPVAPPVVEEIWKGVTIEITFQADTWINVRTDGELKVDGIFPAGATARAQADELLLIHTGNAGGFTFTLNGRPAKPLGRSGQVLTDIKITPDNYREFLESPSSGGPTG
jgi:transcriptional regulator with XRE-family HTH domain